MKRIAWVAIMAACAGTPAKPEPVQAPAVTGSMRDALLAQAAGAPVLVVNTPDGVVARTPERALATLVEGGVTEARYDTEEDLLWIVRGAALEVVDLREPAPKPVAIVHGIPDGIEITVGSEGHSVAGGAVRAPQFLAVNWSADPSLEVEYTIEDLADEEEVAAAKRARLVGRAWLVANRTRAPRASPEARAAAPVRTFPPNGCEDEEECGIARQFGKTGWLLYVARYDCGDYCYWGCLLIDPATQRVAAPGQGTPAWTSADEIEDAGSCGPFLFAADESVYGHIDQLCTPGSACQPMGGRVLGFLEPGPTVRLGW